MSSLLSMQPGRTVLMSSPLGEFLRRRLEQVLARWEAGEGPPASPAGKAALARFLAAVDELGAAADGLLDPAAPRSEQAPGCRVLLVGDAPALGAGLLQELVQSEAEVATASNREQAVQSALERPPDVVVG